MRIFYASNTTPNAAFQSNLWRNNLYQPLVDLGQDMVEFKYDLRQTFQNLNPQNPKQKAFIDNNFVLQNFLMKESLFIIE